MSSAISNTTTSTSQADLMRMLREEEEKKAAAQAEKDGTNKKTDKKTNKKAPGYTTSQSSTDTGIERLQNLMQNAMKSLGLKSADKMTYGTLQEYREKLEKEFSLKTEVGLLAAGVNKDAEFQLISGKDGGIEVVSDSPDKAKIEKFFKDNPSLVKDFQEIQSLKNMKQARESNTLPDMASMRNRLQMEAMGSWWGQGNDTSLIMGYKGGSASFLSGLNLTV